MLIWIISAVALLVLIILMLGYPRVVFPQKAGIEGLEDPAVAQAFDRVSQWPQFKLLRRMVVGELKKYHPKGIIVDVGCGPGYLVAVMAKSFPKLHIIGVDISEEMTRVAAHNLSSLGFSRQVEFRQGDVQKLPLEDDAVDFVVSTLSLHHWQDPARALREIYRVLKPGGQVLIFDLRRDSRRFFYWLLRFAQTLVVPISLRRVGEPTGSILSSYTLAESQALFSATPFRQWRVRPGLGWLFIWGDKD